MPEAGPQSWESVRAQERAALRPGGGGAPLSALCFSGGGIRSATFNLGVLQGLAERGLLTAFDYLSTVSGGGYIGSWLTAWSSRAQGVANVEPWLRPNASPPDGIDPVGHLRAYNNYLSPRVGAASVDTWTLATTVIRNVFLNWLVFVPLLLAVLMLPRVLLALALRPPAAWLLYVLPWLAAGLLAVGLWGVLRDLPDVGGANPPAAAVETWALAPMALAALLWCGFDRLAFAATGLAAWPLPRTLVLALTPCLAAWFAFLIGCGPNRGRTFRAGSLWLAILLLGLGTGMSVWALHQGLLPRLSAAAWVTLAPPLLLVGFGAAAALFVGLSSHALRTLDREWAARAAAVLALAGVVWLLANAAVLLAPAWLLGVNHWAMGALAGVAGVGGWLSALAGFRGAATAVKAAAGGWARLLQPAAAAFLALLAVGLALGTEALLAATGGASLQADLLALAGFAALAWIMARYININKFSLAGMYRDRLIRAYLGASNPASQVNCFTGFAASDDLPLHTLAAVRPLPVLNLTLNLVETERLAWQQRKAESFTATPLACGSAGLGYRPAADYGGRGGITLGTAMAISGAAASPNMGYHSSPLVGFLMTLFNVRLGAWLGNPAAAGRKTWMLAGPRAALGWLLREALGQTSDRSAYVYLSDGGHFENLGLYEMVRRGCHRIVVVDAGCDPDAVFEDLGNALRKIRIDLRVPVAFEDGDLAELRARRRRCAVAAIQYSAVAPGTPDGQMLYLKPVLLGTESPDVASYAAAHPSFPHQSTTDQWFDESQTESYRMLGLETIQEVCRQPALATLLGLPPEAGAARA